MSVATLKVTVTCPGCKARYGLKGPTRRKSLTCKKCGEKIPLDAAPGASVLPAPLDLAPETRPATPPALPTRPRAARLGREREASHLSTGTLLVLGAAGLMLLSGLFDRQPAASLLSQTGALATKRNEARASGEKKRKALDEKYEALGKQLAALKHPKYPTYPRYERNRDQATWERMKAEYARQKKQYEVDKKQYYAERKRLGEERSAAFKTRLEARYGDTEEVKEDMHQLRLARYDAQGRYQRLGVLTLLAMFLLAGAALAFGREERRAEAVAAGLALALVLNGLWAPMQRLL